MTARKALAASVGFALLMVALLAPAAAQADFGIKSLNAEALKQNGSTELQAGAHPFEFKVAFEMNQDSEGEPEGTLREVIFDLPPGMVGNPFAVARCSGADFEGVLPNCPANTQVGTAILHVFTLGPVSAPIYNLTPPLGVAGSSGLQYRQQKQLPGSLAAQLGLRTEGV